MKRMKLPLLAVLACLFAMQLLGGEGAAPKAMDAKLKAAYGYGVFTYGMYEVTQKDTKYAEAAFDLAVENDPKLGRAYLHRGDIAFFRNDFAAAKKDYLASLKREPDYFLACYNLACAMSRSGDKAGALSQIEEALRLGYDRFEKLEKDEDLEATRKGPEFDALLKKYRDQPVKQTDVAKFLLAKTAGGKLAILEKIMELENAPSKPKEDDWKPLADKALLDSSDEVRLAGVRLYRMFGGDLKLDVLARGLFDNNGDVNKFAGNALLAEGDKAVPIVNAILASNYKEAKFYAEQIKKLLTKAGDPPPTTPAPAK